MIMSLELQRLACSNKELVDRFKASSCGGHQGALISLREIRNLTIGSQKQKRAMLILELSKLLVENIIDDGKSFNENELLLTEAVPVINSLLKIDTISPSIYIALMKNDQNQLDKLMHYLISCLDSKNVILVNAVSKCIMLLLQSQLITPMAIFDQIDDPMDTSDSNSSFPETENTCMSKFVNLIIYPLSNEIVVTVLRIWSLLCDDYPTNIRIWERSKRQIFICNFCGVTGSIPQLLSSATLSVSESAVTFLQKLIEENFETALHFTREIPFDQCQVSGVSCVSIICDKLRWDRPRNSQLSICRLLILFLRVGALSESWPKFSFKVLPTLVRLSKSDCSLNQRTQAAELIYLLTETSVQLQKCAVNTDRLMTLLVDYLTITEETKGMEDVSAHQAMKSAAFKALSGLCANDTEAALRMVTDFSILKHLVPCISETTLELKYSALLLLLSLTRSIPVLFNHLSSNSSSSQQSVASSVIQILRGVCTQDSADITADSTVDLRIKLVSSSVMCNLSIPHANSTRLYRSHLVEEGILDICRSLLFSDNANLRINGVWTLMNLSCDSTAELKQQIWHKISFKCLNNLMIDSCSQVAQLTSRLLFNLCNVQKEEGDVAVDRSPESLRCITSYMSIVACQEYIESDDFQVRVSILSWIRFCFAVNEGFTSASAVEALKRHNYLQPLKSIQSQLDAKCVDLKVNNCVQEIIFALT
ncbi:armadillo repeat-containing protein 8-like isoform X2 [Convolutriloba macropyga]|uniref:armadillo repeat-containing protein 8-like isoform X2 n=1 Tax=Convolutriloba macropyga TaxID=536237 RepID=UPI003F52327B